MLTLLALLYLSVQNVPEIQKYFYEFHSTEPSRNIHGFHLAHPIVTDNRRRVLVIPQYIALPLPDDI